MTTKAAACAAASSQTPLRGGAPPCGSKTFFTTLDGVRGLAALLIVVRHTGALVAPLEIQESYLAVDVFFVLSGVVLAQAYEVRLQSGLGALRFAWIRLVRIYPLYFLGGLISVLTILAGIDAPYRSSHLGIYAVLGLFMLPNPGLGSVYVYPLINPSWSLFLELAVNVFYAAAIRRLTNAAIYAIMLAASVGLVVTLCFDRSHSLDIGFRYRSFPFGFFRVGYSFFAGVLIYRGYARRPPPAQGRTATLQACAVVAVIGALLVACPPSSIQPLYDFLVVTVGFPVMVYAAIRVQPAGACARIFAFLGAISYAVYTLHAPLGDLVQDLLKACSRAPIETYAPWSGLGFFLLLIPFCWGIDAAYDVPLRRWLLALRPARPALSGPGRAAPAAITPPNHRGAGG